MDLYRISAVLVRHTWWIRRLVGVRLSKILLLIILYPWLR